MHEPGAGPAAVSVAQAALGLHAPDLTSDDIVGRLVDLAPMVAPVSDVRFLEPGTRVPAGMHTVPVATDDESEGVLAYRGDEAAGVRLTLLAAHAAVAMRNVRRVVEAQRRQDVLRHVAERLQDALLPRPPAIEYTSIAHQYRAAGAEARVGGDFYDVFVLPDGRVLLTVGDVVGKGVEAASRTSRITLTLRSLSLSGLPLAELLARTDEQVTYQDQDLMATIWCAYYTPATGELAFSSLGHPPALLLRGGDNTPIRLELQGLPLGMRDLADDVPEVRNRRLEHGDLLVLYTDGVVEAEGDFLAGQEALVRAISARRDLPLHDMVDKALDELLAGADHLDDALMLLLRRR